MQNTTSIERLNEKISQMLHNYHTVQSEIEILRNDNMTLKMQNEMQAQEIEQLINAGYQKDAEIEEIVKKIESILG